MPQQDATEMRNASFITSSRYRTAAVEELGKGPSIPSKMAERSGVDMQYISRALIQLREREVVELVVPESTKKGRIYALTESGEQAAEVVEGL